MKLLLFVIYPKQVSMMATHCQSCMPNLLTASVVPFIPKLCGIDHVKIGRSGLLLHALDSDPGMIKSQLVDQVDLVDHPGQEGLELVVVRVPEEHQDLQEEASVVLLQQQQQQLVVVLDSS